MAAENSCEEMAKTMHEIYSRFKTSHLILMGKMNFAFWQLALEALLHSKGWLGIVIREPEQPVDPQIDELVRNLIVNSIEASNYLHIMHANTAKEMWDELQKVFGGSGLSRKVALLKSMTPIRLEEFASMEEYVEYTVNASLKIRQMGSEMTDEGIALQLLAGLPDDYWKWIVELDRMKNPVTANFVVDLLLTAFWYTPSVEEIYDDPTLHVNGERNNNTSSPIPLPIGSEVRARSHQTVKNQPSMMKNSNDLSDCMKSLSLTNVKPKEEQSSSGYASPPSSILSYTGSSKKDLMVEVLGEHGGYYEGYVTDVFDDELEVTIEDQFQTVVVASMADVRLVPRKRAEPVVRKGATVEFRTCVAKTFPWGWWMAKISTDVGNGFVVLNIPGWMGSKFGHDECVKVNRIRAPNTNPPICSGTFYKAEIPVPDEHREIAMKKNVHAKFLKAIGAASCRYIPVKQILRVISRNDNLKSLGNWIDKHVFGDKLEYSDSAEDADTEMEDEPQLYTYF